jgi:Zn finger protein HypA/HybF involved in hydrogenase expression
MKCQICKHEFPEEFGGYLCPRCDDLQLDVRDMQEEMNREVDDGE